MIAKIYHYLDKAYLKKNFLVKYRICKIFLNLFMPLYFKFKKRKEMNESSELIISLTSFPARIKKVHLVIETLLRQTVMPQRIILYLSKKQFSGYETLPKKLKKLQKKGYLDLAFVEEDYRSHKKYYYTVEQYPLNSFITVDDDFFYPEDLVEALLVTKEKFSGTIGCILADKMEVAGDELESYEKWTPQGVKIDEESYSVLPIGCGGVYYPVDCFDTKRLLNSELFLKLCPAADDLWLKWNTVLNGKKSVKIGEYKNFVFVDIVIKNNVSLCQMNVQNAGNDEQIRRLVNVFPQVVKIIIDEERHESIKE